MWLIITVTIITTSNTNGINLRQDTRSEPVDSNTGGGGYFISLQIFWQGVPVLLNIVA